MTGNVDSMQVEFTDYIAQRPNGWRRFRRGGEEIGFLTFAEGAEGAKEAEGQDKEKDKDEDKDDKDDKDKISFSCSRL
jgi:hypothetical protein